MKMRSRRSALTLALALALPVWTAPAHAGMQAAQEASPDGGCCMIPAETPVMLEVMETVGSRHSRSGQMFAIRLAQPIVVEGRTLVPAGAEGVAEVVHAARGGNKGGELIVSARSLRYRGVSVPLHRTRFARTGKETSMWVMWAPSPFISTSGNDVELKAGSLLPAFVAAPTAVPPAGA